MTKHAFSTKYANRDEVVWNKTPTTMGCVLTSGSAVIPISSQQRRLLVRLRVSSTRATAWVPMVYTSDATFARALIHTFGATAVQQFIHSGHRQRAGKPSGIDVARAYAGCTLPIQIHAVDAADSWWTSTPLRAGIVTIPPRALLNSPHLVVICACPAVCGQLPVSKRCRAQFDVLPRQDLDPIPRVLDEPTPRSPVAAWAAPRGQ